MAEMKFRLIKFFNILKYFRTHLHELEYTGTFLIKHPDHFSDHSGYYESVKFISYDERKKEYTVKRTSHRDGQKSIIVGVHASQIFLNAK